MKRQIKPLVASLCLLGCIAMPAFADDKTQQAEKMQALEKQLAALQHEMAALKNQLQTTQTTKHHVKKKAVKARATTAASLEDSKQKDLEITGPEELPRAGVDYLPVDIGAPGQSFVTTGPYIGVPLQYSGSNLIVNNPNINEDVSLLKLRQNVNKRLAQLGVADADEHSHLLLSGVVEAQANYKDIGGGSNSSDVDVTSAGIDAYILGPSSWTSGLLTLSYENNIGAQTGSITSNSRSENSRVFINKAFITVGDFSKTPFYGTVGQMYVPFGTYSNVLVSSPLTKLLARVHTRALLVGYQEQTPNAFYGSVYGFKGDTHVGAARRINNGGVNAGYRFAINDFSADIGGGAIANIADSQGMQDTGGSSTTPLAWGGFGGANGTGNEQLIHRVPAYNLRGLFSYGKTIDVIMEYVGASTSFSPIDLTMNSHAAKPQAADIEFVYSFQHVVHPSSIGVAYGMSKDALALGLPAQRYSLVYNTSWWKNTLQSLEFRHDINYAASAISTGSSIPAGNGSGKSDNVVTAQFDIYF